MAKKKKKNDNLLRWSDMIIYSYLLMMLGVFPLYYQNNYYNIGDAKYRFFRLVTLIMLIYLIVTQIGVRLIERKKEHSRIKFSIMDYAVLAYGAATIWSWVLSPYKTEAWIGSGEWYMGLFSQLLFIGIYFAMSRYGTEERWPLWVMGVSGAIVFLVAYLHRFNIDPLGMYKGVADNQKIGFLGLIGQSSWYSSYICVVLPVMMGIYVTVHWKNTTTDRCKHILLGVFLFLGFCSAVTQNTDSIYLGIGLAFLFFLWFALEDMKIWKRLIEMGILAVAAAKFTGVLQMKFPEKVIPLDPLSFMVTKSKAGWLVLIAGILVYGLTCLLERRYAGKELQKLQRWIRLARLIFYILVIAAILSLPLMVWLVTTGRKTAETGILQESGYLVFDWNWGNGRGRTWSYCMRVFLEFSPLRKLFGCGPDSLAFYTAVHHAEEVQGMWGGLILTNAHNEWLTALVDYGIVGAVCYIGVFITAWVRSIQYQKARPALLAAGAVILAYVGHNFFCYQQVICTPFIFIVMGISEYLIRKEKQIST